MNSLCKTKCLADCCLRYYDFKGQFVGYNPETVINLIPKVIPLIEYSETIKTDLDNLIYNFGGLLGLWFGFSGISISDLTLICLQFMKNSLIFVQFLKNLLLKF